MARTRNVGCRKIMAYSFASRQFSGIWGGDTRTSSVKAR